MNSRTRWPAGVSQPPRCQPAHSSGNTPFRSEIKDVFAANDTMRTQAMRFGGALQAGYFLLAVRACGLGLFLYQPP